MQLGHAELVVTRPLAAAADGSQDALFTARAALKRAYGLRAAAETQVNQMRELVDRLEASRREP